MRCVVLRHPAVLQRCWTIHGSPSACTGVLHSRKNGEEVRTEVGTLYLVLDAIKHCRTHRGAPVFKTPVRPSQRESL